MGCRGAWRFALLWVSVIGCTPTTISPFKHSDAGIEGGVSGCPASFTTCDHVCCAPGMTCAAGTCKFPYNAAHLYVYLCPSFNTGNCKAGYFALDQTCSPVTAPAGGTCYDTGFEVSAGQTYGLASCTACGNGCSSPASFRAPPGFLEPQYYSGFTWSCGSDKCQAPIDCGGRSADAGGSGGGGGRSTCTTSDCFFDGLSIKENGTEIPHVVIHAATPPASSKGSDPSNTPQLTKVTSTKLTAGAEIDYTFDDPTGCSPGTCISLASCPRNLQCNLGTSVCTHAKRDGALAGAVIRTLGFKTEPVDPSIDLPLQLQPIAGPIDPMTGMCTDPIDDSDPSHPALVAGALVGDPQPFNVTLVASQAPGGAAGAGGAGATDAGTPPPGGGAGQGGGGSCGLPLQCRSDADCSGFGARNCNPTNGARCGADGKCHCCFASCSSGGGGCSCISCASGCTNDQSCMGSVCAFNVGGTPCD